MPSNSPAPPPPPAAALAAKCQQWRSEAAPPAKPEDHSPGAFDQYLDAIRDSEMAAVRIVPLAARALEVLVEAMGKIAMSDGWTVSMDARDALRRAAAIVEEVSDGQA